MRKNSSPIPKNLSWNWNIFNKPVDGLENSEFSVRRANSQRPRKSKSPELESQSYNHTICYGNLAQFNSAISSSQTQDWVR